MNTGSSYGYSNSDFQRSKIGDSQNENRGEIYNDNLSDYLPTFLVNNLNIEDNDKTLDNVLDNNIIWKMPETSSETNTNNSSSNVNIF